MHDRLPELIKLSAGNPFMDDIDDDEEIEQPFLKEFFQKTSVIRTELSQMKTRVQDLQKLYSETIEDVDNKQKKKKGKDAEVLIDAVNGQAQKIRTLLKQLGDSFKKNDSNGGFNTEERIQKNLHTSLLNEFLELMQVYQSLQSRHNEEVRNLVISQVKIVKPNATEEEVENVIQSGGDQIFATSKSAAQDSLNYIKDRHNEIVALEKSLEEVHQLFVDMAVLVEEQSEKINRIAFQVANVKKDILAATEDLREAKKIKSRQCIVQ
eukprot:TRINITY_DN2084_c0_g1_i1.p1 TRINITY_DN2084_c0_g1~~TRINITY_DN2084_c0_g1_i1.p1  ORF type:complete len:266 (-),score=59.83 TRINITY_DN2084_c0_g1_i1:84-881(-)